MDFGQSEILQQLIRDGLRAGSVGAGRADKVASAPIVGEEDRTSERSPTAGGGNQPIGNSGKGRGAKPRQFTGGDVQQMKRAPKLRIIFNPNHMAQAMPTADMGMRIRPSSLAPAGMSSPMLVVIEGGKR